MASDDPRIHLINAQLTRLGLSARWLADKIGVSNVALSKWLNGDSVPRNKDSWTQMLSVLKDYEKDISNNKTVALQRVGLRKVIVYPSITAGMMGSVEADSFTLDLKDWGTDRERWGRTISGHSMEPELIPEDIVIFEDRPYEPYHVVHAFDNGEDTIKVVRGHGDSVELVPINPDYSVLPARNVNIKGVAVARIRKGPEGIVTTTEYPHGMRFRVHSQKA